ncbi:uncharacterized protein LOC143917621 [Arctopsyche grandis]|uniref:uncharacterized protein LOC143917621 n=1 Tax=Arctopsyche grandis TaxID=121162 RepID=UPI00406D9D3C
MISYNDPTFLGQMEFLKYLGIMNDENDDTEHDKFDRKPTLLDLSHTSQARIIDFSTGAILEQHDKTNRRRRKNGPGTKSAQSLKKLSLYQKQRLLNETEEQRKRRLERLRINQRRRLSNETEEQRQHRLSQMRINQKRRLMNETEEQRRIRLARLREYQQKRQFKESAEQRRERLNKMSYNQELRLSQKAAALTSELVRSNENISVSQ